ncbi:hypothetical protein MXM41_07415 [Leclercia adecarboxylata]|uniref:hypothetical protein n=1 Tax=Leclercia adecarboxylata TaxID=83655 RepID=UPI002DBD1829|nr:hypothetical protein [Leclercia adecarboxylata]MEB6378760.1 hypothetical protein [Leclercia adecarboxylata]
MSQFTVSSFVIEVGFKESVTQKLTRLESQVNKAASRIEKQLNGAFSRLNGAQKTGEMFKQIQRQADQTSNHIQKALQRGFAVGGIGGGMFARYQQEGMAAANAVRDAMQAAARAGVPAGNPRPYTPRINNRLSGAESIRNLSHRQTTSSFYGNMQLRNPQLAQQYQQRLNELRNSSLMGNRDVTAFRENLRSMNFEFSQIMRQASITRSQQRLNAMEGSGALSRLSGAATTLAVGFLSLQKSVEFFGEALQEGAKRQQASTMLRTAYGDQAKAITAAVDEYANKYGADRLEARQQAAQLRMTMPKDIFSDTDIPKLLETESVFAHQTGMTQDAVGRLNYAMQQIATSTHLMGGDWLQVVNASPALIQQLLQLTGKKSVKDLKELAQTMSGADFVQKMVQAMEQLNNKTNAAVAAQNSMMAVQGRMSNAIKDSQDKFFQGLEGGLKNLLTAAAGLLGDNQDIFMSLGKSLGSFFNTLAGYVYALDNFTMISKAYLADLSDWWKKFFKSLPEPVQKGLSGVGDIITSFIKGVSEAALLYMGVGIAGKGAGLMARLAGLGGAGTAVTGAGAVSGGFLTAIIPTVVAAVASYFIARGTGDAVFGAAKSFSDKQYGEDKIAGGNLYKNSPLGKVYTWLNEQFADVPDNWSQAVNAPLLPGLNASPGNNAAAPQRLQVQLSPVQFNPLTLNIPLPDNSTYTTTVDVNQLIQNQAEVTMMSAQGLGGGWQIPGQNAGFSPSLLKR